MSCMCEKCIANCWNNPGWFGSIEEVEGAAKILGTSVQTLCESFLIREWYRDEVIMIPAPRRNFSRKDREREACESKIEPRFREMLFEGEQRKNGPGFVVASWGHNLITGVACIFLDEGNRCRIQDSKPAECRKTYGCKRVEGDEPIRERIQDYWKMHQDWIAKILKEVEK